MLSRACAPAGELQPIKDLIMILAKQRVELAYNEPGQAIAAKASSVQRSCAVRRAGGRAVAAMPALPLP